MSNVDKDKSNILSDSLYQAYEAGYPDYDQWSKEDKDNVFGPKEIKDASNSWKK